MFHIKNDKRAKTSAGLLVEALDDCLAEINYAELSITRLCQISTVSRATFYRLFDNINDVLEYKCYLLVQDMESRFIGKSSKDIMISFFGLWMQQASLLHVIFEQHLEQILYQLHTDHSETLSKHFLKLPATYQMTSYHQNMLTYIMVGSLKSWLEDGQKETPTELVMRVQVALKDLLGALS